MKKPSPAAARVLANIFSTECEKRPAAEAFDPTDVCVANPAKKKKRLFDQNLVISVLQYCLLLIQWSPEANEGTSYEQKTGINSNANFII